MLKFVPTENIFKIAVVTNGRLNGPNGTPMWKYHISAMIKFNKQDIVIDPCFGICSLSRWYKYLGVDFTEPSYFTSDVMYNRFTKKNIYLYMNWDRTLNVYSFADCDKLIECEAHEYRSTTQEI